MSDVFFSTACEGSSFVDDHVDTVDDIHEASTSSADQPSSPQDADTSLDEETSDSDGERIECPFCGMVFEEGDMAQHVSLEHRLGCLRCRRMLATEDELEAHLQQHEDTFTCNLCDEQFDDEAEYEFHRMSEHNALKCTKCSQVLLDHEYKAHSDSCHQRKQVLKPLRESGGGAIVVLEPGSRRSRRRGGVVGENRGGGRPAREIVSAAEKVRRATKGEMERERRAQLSKSYEMLRVQLPSLKNQGATATKQAILIEAVSQIKTLEEQSHTYHKVRLLLTRQKQRMEVRVNELGSTPILDD